MSQNVSQSSVYILGLDGNSNGFANFCRLNASDLVVDSSGVFCASVHSDSNAQQPTDISILFGLWPRIFTDSLTLSDSIMERARLDLQNGKTVSLILVAANAKTVINSPIVDGIRSLQSASGQSAARLWSLAMLTSGPESDIKNERKLAADKRYPIRTVFYLGTDARNTGTTLSPSHSSQLRFLIDLCREDDDLRSSIRRDSGRYVLSVDGGNSENSAVKMNSLLGNSLKHLNNVRVSDEALEIFESDLKSRIESLQPISETETVLPDPPGDPLPQLNNRVAATSTAMTKALKDAEDQVKQHYDMYRREKLTPFLQFQLKKHQKRTEEFLNSFEDSQISIPTGGYSSSVRTSVSELLSNVVQKTKDDWSSSAQAAREANRNLLVSSADAKNSANANNFSYEKLAEVQKFNKALREARIAAFDLPKTRASLAISSFTFASIFGLWVFMFFLKTKGDKTTQRWSMLLFDSSIFSSVFAILVILIMVCLFLYVGARGERNKHINRVKLAATNISKPLIAYTKNTSEYLDLSSSAFLVGELYKGLKRRIVNGPFSDLANVSSLLFPPNRLNSISQFNELAALEISSTRPVEEWVRDLANRHAPDINTSDSVWEISFREEAIQRSSRDEYFERDTTVELPTTYIQGRAQITLQSVSLKKAANRKISSLKKSSGEGAGK